MKKSLLKNLLLLLIVVVSSASPLESNSTPPGPGDNPYTVRNVVKAGQKSIDDAADLAGRADQVVRSARQDIQQVSNSASDIFSGVAEVIDVKRKLIQNKVEAVKSSVKLTEKVVTPLVAFLQSAWKNFKILTDFKVNVIKSLADIGDTLKSDKKAPTN